MKAVYASSKCIWSNKSIQKDEFDKMAKNARETMGGYLCVIHAHYHMKIAWKSMKKHIDKRNKII